ncbi:hypothetical protein B0J11DRAFT_462393 [Dendryphion nanum]|uniref:R3H domain-containing protein n=1 Tax=Dendryphion nanum TaxID=256645 RepID=A0A9P9DV10_9PLEO|nr:hypothetical protein B0J11DRAFT_462393 [Dendryphion nanum]
MASLTGLPTELRQRILSIALSRVKDINMQPPRCLINLLHINHRLRLDMGPVLDLWNPIHHISSPKLLPSFRPWIFTIDGIPVQPKGGRMCIDVFCDVKEDNTAWPCYSVDESHSTYALVAAAWSNAVPLLPTEIKELYVDITPILARRRREHRLIIGKFLRHRRVLEFVSSHFEEIMELLSILQRRYQGTVPIFLTGLLSTKSRSFVERISAVDGLEFRGTWFTQEDSHWPDIQEALKYVAPPPKGKAKTGGVVNPLAYLRNLIKWSDGTKWMYAKLVDMGEFENVVMDLRLLGEFRNDTERLTLSISPASPSRRALQHKIAKDLGLETRSGGEGDGRYIILSRKPLVVPAAKC